MKSYRFAHPDAPNARNRVHSHVMLRLLGVRKIPLEGMPACMLPGDDSTGAHVEIKTWIVPLTGAPERGASGRLLKRSAHRVRCECPGCGTELSAGRLFQHRCEPPLKTPADFQDQHGLSR